MRLIDKTLQAKWEPSPMSICGPEDTPKTAKKKKGRQDVKIPTFKIPILGSCI